MIEDLEATAAADAVGLVERLMIGRILMKHHLISTLANRSFALSNIGVPELNEFCSGPATRK